MNDRRILVVDDEPALRRALRATLTALGFMVADAASGEEALEALRLEPFDLILLDNNMPGISGVETCRAIRERSDVSILMVTVRDRSADKIEALDAGADGYVTKPFDMSEMLARIRATLRRSPVPAEWVDLGDVEISFRDRQIRKHGNAVRLTPKEQDLLYFFVTHPDTVLTHQQILRAVWGSDYGDEVEYLRVFVNQLRKKLELDPARPCHLLTEPWLGYRFSTAGERKAKTRA